MFKSKKLLKFGAVIITSAAMMFGGAVAVQAATGTSWYCSVTANTPFKSGTQIKATGSASGCSGTLTKFYTQVHRSEGFTHPEISSWSQEGRLTSFSGSSQGCDDNNNHVYFSQAWMQLSGSNGGIIISANSGTLKTTC